MKKWAGIAITAIFVLTFVLNLTAGGHHEESSWHHLPGLYIILGFGGCIAFVVMAKALGKYFLQRDDQYYEKG
ncbi:MAG: hypothetical protein H5T99_04420 [Moorella sp. (in: Bacteria)]|nr:hypothetical protein [Moorella sp. (in: firmicutes)]